MYGDFSRLTFTEADNYAAVWSQQGRVQVDSDLNELTAIMLDHLRRLTVDTLGPFAASYPGTALRVSTDPEDQNDLWIEPGDYYVHGLRCRLSEQDNSGLSRPQRYRSHAGRRRGVDPLPAVPFLVEVVVWEQTLSAVQRPRLLDPGLGPYAPDSLRTAVRFALRTTSELPDGAPVTGTETARGVSLDYLEQNNRAALPSGRPLLTARTRPPSEPDDPALLPAHQGYRRPENQLYRVEVHSGGTAQPLGGGWRAQDSSGEGGVEDAPATFTFSRDNASVQFRVHTLGRSSEGELTATLGDEAADPYTGLDEGDWVELRDDSWLPWEQPLPLLEVVRVDRGARRLVLAGPDDFDPQSLDETMHPYLLRWDQQLDDTAADNAVPIPAPGDGRLRDGWLELEDGVQIRFDDPDAHYRPGDYWLLPARSGTGRLLWPADVDGHPATVQASRPVVHRAPLALVTAFTADGVRDLRSFGRAAPPWDVSGRSGGSGPGEPAGVDVASGQPAPAGGGGVDDTLTSAGGTALADTATSAPDATSLIRAMTATTSQGRVAGGTSTRVVRLTVEPYDDSGSEDPMTAGWTRDLPPGRWSVGRGPGQDVQLTDTTVSSTHATLQVDTDGCRIWDTGPAGSSGSTNGTFLVRDGRTTPVVESTALQQGDVVRFGTVPMRVDFL